MSQYLFSFWWGGVIVAHIFIEHERNQSVFIVRLQSQITELYAHIDEMKSGNSSSSLFRESVSESGFDYLAIGNSITLHSISDYWWTECGMAASRAEFDYYHLICDWLCKEHSRLNTGVYNFNVWEVQAHDRAQTYGFLDSWLTKDIDLVTVQLSENCSDLNDFKSDYKSLLNYIRMKCGENCLIIVIDDFWDSRKHEMKESVVKEMGNPYILFVNLLDVQGDAQYQASIGSVVFDNEGNEHIIEHSGVAHHPSDEGMRLIAQRVLEIYDNTK